MNKRGAKDATLFDRFALAFFSGALALVLGTVGWMLAISTAADVIVYFPFRYVAYFAVGMAVLGFLLCENVIIEVLGALLELIFTDHDRAPPGWLVAGLVIIVAALIIWWLMRR